MMDMRRTWFNMKTQTHGSFQVSVLRVICSLFQKWYGNCAKMQVFLLRLALAFPFKIIIFTKVMMSDWMKLLNTLYVDFSVFLNGTNIKLWTGFLWTMHSAASQLTKKKRHYLMRFIFTFSTGATPRSPFLVFSILLIPENYILLSRESRYVS